MNIVLSKIFFINVVLLNSFSFASPLYVVPFVSSNENENDGSILHPFSSIQQALDHVQQETIYLYPTYYFLTNIRLHQAHSYMQLTTMNSTDADFYDTLLDHHHTYPRLTKAVISGGMPITNWTHLVTILSVLLFHLYHMLINYLLMINVSFVLAFPQIIPNTFIMRHHSMILLWLDMVFNTLKDNLIINH